MANMASTDGAVIVTVPPNRNWLGTVVLSAAQTTAPGAAAGACRPSVTISGTGGNYGDGDTVIALALSVPAVALTALIGASAHNSASTGPINIQARENEVTAILHVPAGTNTVATASGALQ